MEDDSWQSMMPDIDFHRTSTRPTHLKLVSTPLVIINTIYQAHGTASYPPLKASCMMAMTFSHFHGSGCSSRFAARCLNLWCSAFIPDRPPT